MVNLIKSEYIKGRRSVSRKSLVFLPLLVSLMSIVLMGGKFSQMGAYNWWYMMFLPICVALICINLIDPEKRMRLFNISILPVQKGKLWFAKVFAGCFYLFVGNLILFGLTKISGAFFGSQYSILRGFAASLVLTVTWAWLIPLGMFLSTEFNSMVTFLGILSANVICSIQTIAGGKYCFIPFAIPARLMAPILSINPNGVPMTADSPLHDTGVLLPGLLITILLFIITLSFTKKWFNDRSE